MSRRNIRVAVEHWFEAAGRRLYKHPKKTLGIVAAVVVCLSIQIPSITIDTSSEALLRKNDPSLMLYNDFRDQFGRAELIIVAVEGPDVFDAGYLARLKALHAELRDRVPYLRDITSLINVRRTTGENDELVVRDLLSDWPERAVDLRELRLAAMQHPLYSDYILSRDGRVSALIVETEARVQSADDPVDILEGFEQPDAPPGAGDVAQRYFSEQENREVVEAVNRIAARHAAPGFVPIVSGGPVIVYAFNQATLQDVSTCIVLAFIAVATFLGLLFRRLSGVLMPIAVIAATLLSTLGIMAMLGTPIKITTTVIPGFLLSVGVCDSVHILAIFYRELSRGRLKDDAMAYALGHSGLAVVMTSLTTVAGLLSFLAADLTAITEIGVYAAAGVMLALVYTIALLPALVALFPLAALSKREKGAFDMGILLEKTALFATGHASKIMVAGLVLLLVALPAIFTLRFSHNIVRYFPDNNAYRRNLAFVDDRLNGTITLEVVLDTGRENGLYDPGILEGIERFSRQVRQYRSEGIEVGKVMAVTDILKETNQALNNNAPGEYRIPEGRDLIAQEFFLFENTGADDLQRIVDGLFSKTRITIKTPWVDAVECRQFVGHIENELAGIFGSRADFHATGLMALLARALMAAIYSMAKSYVIAFLVITLMMVVMVGDLKLGLVSMVPNLLPIVLTMGLMGWTDTPLDINSLMIGSIALGIVVDDTVHFLYNFQKYYQKNPDPVYAVRQTLLGTGRALLITSLVLCTGFFILMTASLRHLVNFGLFTGITILLALAADFLLMPALLAAMKGQGRRTAALQRLESPQTRSQQSER